MMVAFVFGDRRILVSVVGPSDSYLVTSVRLCLEFYQNSVNVNVFRALGKWHDTLHTVK